MTHQVLKSQLRGMTDFPAKVSAHLAELVHHAKHMADVAQGRADPYPPPYAPPLIDDAIRREAQPGGSIKLSEDYQIVDDGPTEAEIFAQKKHELLSEIARREQVAIHAILPRGKQRLASLMLAAALKKPEASRGDDDNKVIAEAEDRRGKIETIDLHAATLMAQVEDLTPQTIGAWSPAAFPQV